MEGWFGLPIIPRKDAILLLFGILPPYATKAYGKTRVVYDRWTGERRLRTAALPEARKNWQTETYPASRWNLTCTAAEAMIKCPAPDNIRYTGEMAEWLKAPVSKTG